ncbi:MAG: alpha/beta hydrolase [Anaerolineales bacterium]|nr:alpha/beta hydrolase [Anaerolineales bacterium]
MMQNVIRKFPKKRSGCLWSFTRWILGLFILLIVLVPLGMIYQSAALKRDAQRYPYPGELVDVGEFRLHIYCIGSGTPTVVLEAGLGDGSFIWGQVQNKVATSTRVCAYDRPGLGWSDFVNRQFRRQAVAENLHTLLVNAGIPGPYILVGHSVGGIYVRAFAQKYPKEVAGLVFVDSSHENQSVRMDGGRVGPSRMLDYMLAFCDIVAPTGVFRLFGVANALMEDTGLPVELRQAAIATLNRDTYCRTIANEMSTSDKDTSLSSGPPKLGDIPLIVLVAGSSFGNQSENNSSGAEPGSQGRGNQRWLRLQDELTHLSSNGRQIIAEDSSHYIHLDQPELVVRAILDILKIARSN